MSCKNFSLVLQKVVKSAHLAPQSGSYTFMKLVLHEHRSFPGYDLSLGEIFSLKEKNTVRLAWTLRKQPAG